jgi:cytochrome c oxidase cbb3-type subunit 1
MAEVDRSFRTVAFYFLAKSGFWVAAGAFFLLLASIKLHAPSMLSSQAWLTYGRILPAGWNMLVYGFVGQAGTVVGLWLLARLSRQCLQVPLLVLAGGVLWNLGVFFGVIGILLGYSTGQEMLEMPAGARVVMFAGVTLVGISGWLTFAQRNELETYPSAWFVALALLAAVWCGSTALLMPSGDGVRGVVQVLVQRWHANGVMNLWLGALGLAIVYYALPQCVQRPLASRQLALWAFWCLALFSPWAVAEHGDPFPRWIIAVAKAGQTLGMIGLLATAINWWKTVEGAWRTLCATLAGKLIATAAIAYVAHGALRYLAFLNLPTGIDAGGFDSMIQLPDPPSIVGLTWIHYGLDWLLVGGAAGLAVMSALPGFLAAAGGRTVPAGWVTLHAWLSAGGVALISVPLIIAGGVQGGLLSGGSGFMEALRASMHLVRLSSLGLTVFFLGQVIWFVALLGVWWATVREARAQFHAWTTPAPARVEARS